MIHVEYKGAEVVWLDSLAIVFCFRFPIMVVVQKMSYLAVSFLFSGFL